MKKITLVALAAIAFSAFSCSDNDNEPNNVSLTGKWNLTSITSDTLWMVMETRYRQPILLPNLAHVIALPTWSLETATVCNKLYELAFRWAELLHTFYTWRLCEGWKYSNNNY